MKDINMIVEKLQAKKAAQDKAKADHTKAPH